MKWEEIVQKARLIKHTFDASYKCLNTSRYTSEETIYKHLEILINSLKKIQLLLNVNYQKLSSGHKAAAEAFYFDIRDKLIAVAQRKGIEIDIPDALHEEVLFNLKRKQETQVTKAENMALSVAAFLGLASKILPEFDGKSENLQSFLDGLTLLNSVKETHESVAVSLVKTKLKGTARNLIASESTIQEIIDKLKTSVKGESTEVLTAKILNIKQNSKSATNFVHEIEELTKSLANAYIADGLSSSLAEKYSTQVAVRSMVQNASNERVRLIMESGTFSSMNEAVTKFVNSCTNNTSGSNVLYYNSRSGNRGSRGAENGRGRARNYNRGRGNGRGRGRYQRGRGNFNNQTRRSTNYQTRCVHDRGNQHSPEATHLGDNDN